MRRYIFITILLAIAACSKIQIRQAEVLTPEEIESYNKGIPEKVLADSVSLDPTSLLLIVGQSYTLNAIVYPENTTDKSVRWSSSEPEVASVVNGLVKAHAVGTSEIIVQTNSGNYVARCQVRVKKGIDDGATEDLTIYDLETIL